MPLKCLCLLLFVFISGLSFGQEASGNAEGEQEPQTILQKILTTDSADELRKLAKASIDSFPENSSKGRVLAIQASLEFLAGNPRTAAELWIQAHSLTADDSYLLDAARSLLLTGEFNATLAHLDRIINRGQDFYTRHEASELSQQILALKEKKWPEIFDPRKGSPEQKILEQSNTVYLMPHPLWLLDFTDEIHHP